MLPPTRIGNFSRGRLKRLLLLFFLALAVPTAALIWQAYGQLKWESFHQYRGAAEELTARIDARLADAIRAADQRSYADYTFLVVTGEPSANFVQRSPLSALPVTHPLPGVIGYFQVGSAGEFSTPLLPSAGTDAASLGIGVDELVERQKLSAAIHAVLSDNELVRARAAPGLRSATPASPSPAALGAEAHEPVENASHYRQSRPEHEVVQVDEAEPAAEESVAQANRRSFAVGTTADKDVPTTQEESKSHELTAPVQSYSQQVFDQLGDRDDGLRSQTGTAANAPVANDLASEAPPTLRKNTIGKVSDLKLDQNLQRKSESAERSEADAAAVSGGRIDNPQRGKRREQTALPEAMRPGEEPAAAELTGPQDLRISTFESEVDPFEFSLLDSGHFVIFRKVWRNDERLIQGLLLDQRTFLENAIESAFIDTALFTMSNLIVANNDDVIHTASSVDANRSASYPAEMDGELLYRNRLSAPLDSLELIFTIQSLPAGPGARVLGWVTLVLAIVLVGGFMTLYRLGLSQIQLARQQQDFVSAVSHELKTPLTSIRMYGEMLKEGWADAEKRQSYYEFIHDESERLTRMISNVLQLASITRNEPSFDLKPVKVGELIGNIESKIGNQVERAGFKLTSCHSDEACSHKINIDEDCFAQIVINLVDNAIKFSKNADNKEIDISCTTGPDKTIVFSVRDYGPGIPRDQLKKIFGLFYRSENELTRETVGTGIGLAIVHQLALAMSGSLDVVNRHPGAEFRVVFPVLA